MTKQLNNVTDRAVPAPAVIRYSGKVFEILKRTEEFLFPDRWLCLDLGQRPRDPTPCILDGAVQNRPISLFQTVLHIPDLFSNRGGKARHGGDSPFESGR